MFLFLCARVSGQPAIPANQTLHVRGTITDPLEAVVSGVKVTFQSERFSQTVMTSDVGVYDIDLPPGDYTMTAEGRGFRKYRRPLFRLASPASLDATLLIGPPCGDMVIINSSGEPATEQQIEAATETCRREDLISIPPADGLPLQLSIRYGSRTQKGDICSYTGEVNGQFQTPVFVTYTLFSLRANRVRYDARSKKIEASGDVRTTSGSGHTDSANFMVFKIKKGEVKLVRQGYYRR